MKKPFTPSVSTNSEVASLFERVALIVESGRGRVLHAVNHEMVLVYWLIGREIVQALQGGETRAQYGNALIADLSKSLAEHYGAGFSAANLKNFRQFYLAYADRAVSISHPSGSPLAASGGLDPISYPTGSESLSGFNEIARVLASGCGGICLMFVLLWSTIVSPWKTNRSLNCFFRCSTVAKFWRCC